jgi:hypothetical protein
MFTNLFTFYLLTFPTILLFQVIVYLMNLLKKHLSKNSIAGKLLEVRKKRPEKAGCEEKRSEEKRGRERRQMKKMKNVNEMKRKKQD